MPGKRTRTGKKPAGKSVDRVLENGIKKTVRGQFFFYLGVLFYSLIKVV